MSQLNKLVKQALVVLAFLGTAISLSTAPGSRTVVVAGATGRVGKHLCLLVFIRACILFKHKYDFVYCTSLLATGK